MNANKLPIIQSANFWIILAVIAFLLLPSHALDYGLFESTSDEYLGAMGWSSLNRRSSHGRPCLRGRSSSPQ